MAFCWSDMCQFSTSEVKWLTAKGWERRADRLTDMQIFSHVRAFWKQKFISKVDRVTVRHQTEFLFRFRFNEFKYFSCLLTNRNLQVCQEPCVLFTTFQKFYGYWIWTSVKFRFVFFDNWAFDFHLIISLEIQLPRLKEFHCLLMKDCKDAMHDLSLFWYRFLYNRFIDKN